MASVGLSGEEGVLVAQVGYDKKEKRERARCCTGIFYTDGVILQYLAGKNEEISFLFADDVVLLASSARKLQHALFS